MVSARFLAVITGIALVSAWVAAAPPPAVAAGADQAARSSYESAIESITADLLNPERVRRLGIKNLKVNPFVENRKPIPELSENLIVRISSALASDQNQIFGVVAPDTESLKSELARQTDHFFEPDEVARQGKLKGWSHVLIGMFRDSPDDETLYVHPNLIDVSTGAIAYGFHEIGIRYSDLPYKLMGPLDVSSDPSEAEVLLDGKLLLEKTPLTGHLVPVGRHDVTVRRDGWGEKTQKVSISRREPTKLAISFRDATGNLEVVSREWWAVVFVNGQLAGQVPVVLKLPVGDHRVDVKREGYQSYSEMVHIRANETAQVQAQLNLIPRKGDRLGFDGALTSGLTAEGYPYDILGGGMTSGHLPGVDVRLGAMFAPPSSLFRSRVTGSLEPNPMVGWRGELDLILSTHQFGWTTLTPYGGYGIRTAQYTLKTPGATGQTKVFTSRAFLAGIRVFGWFFAEARYPDAPAPDDPASGFEVRAGIGSPVTLKGWW